MDNIVIKGAKTNMQLIGKQIPNITTSAIVDGKNIEDNYSLFDLNGRYIILFFYPLDFTFVCPTELHAFQENLAEFEKRNCQIVGCSVDSKYCHLAWLQTSKNKGGIEGITFPLLSDTTKQLSMSFGVLKEDEGIAYRGLFLIDKNGVIRHYLINDMPFGRSIDEALRILDALIFHENNGQVCPANWNKNKKAMQPTSEGVKDYFTT